MCTAAMVNDVVVIILTNSSVRVSWGRLLISEISQYLVSYQLMGNRKSLAINRIVVATSTESSVDIVGLISGAEYQFLMAAQAEVEGEIILGRMTVHTFVTPPHSTRPVTVSSIPHSTQPVTVASLPRSTRPNSLGEGLNMLYCVNIAQADTSPISLPYLQNIKHNLQSQIYLTQACSASFINHNLCMNHHIG